VRARVTSKLIDWHSCCIRILTYFVCIVICTTESIALHFFLIKILGAVGYHAGGVGGCGGLGQSVTFVPVAYGSITTAITIIVTEPDCRTTQFFTQFCVPDIVHATVANVTVRHCTVENVLG
jgi:hypothetical protein